jgi:ubiquinone/menaquinone biosynthesis C-methylase UbiE
MDAQEKRRYHMEELRIAVTPGDWRRVMPEIPADCESVLDIGCGAGQSLIAANLPSHVLVVGVEIDLDSIRIGKELTSKINFVCASGEALPFARHSFDFVLSRVALPYMNIPKSLDEIARVLVPGARVWLVLHKVRLTLRHLANAFFSFELKGACFQCYVLLAGAMLHLTGRLIACPFAGGRYESFQTSRGVAKLLRERGFERIEIPEGKFFVVTAQKRETP